LKCHAGICLEGLRNIITYLRIESFQANTFILNLQNTKHECLLLDKICLEFLEDVSTNKLHYSAYLGKVT
jgi:hypothetical protein